MKESKDICLNQNPINHENNTEFLLKKTVKNALQVYGQYINVGVKLNVETPDNRRRIKNNICSHPEVVEPIVTFYNSFEQSRY